MLLERVCKDAQEEGFEILEAYPYREHSNQSSDFGGYVEMYKSAVLNSTLIPVRE